MSKDRSQEDKSFTARTTASLPSDVYQGLQEIARKKKVSISWVIREAAEQYVTDQKAPSRRGVK